MPVGHHLTEAEVGGDQRGVGLDVRAHHQDVAGLQRLVVGEQTEQYLAQYVDLTGRAVAAVHLHRTVGRAMRTTLRPNLVGGDIRLQPAQQRVGVPGAGQDDVGRRGDRQAALQFPQIPPEGGQQGMLDPAMAVVVAACDPLAQIGQPGPQHRAGMRQPEVDLMVGRECVEQFDVGGRQPGVAEQRYPLRQVGGSRNLQLCNGFRLSDVRRVDRHDVHQPAPEFRLPGQVSRKAGGVTRQPPGQQVRALPRVRREQPGQPSHHRVAAAPPQLLLVVAGAELAEMGGQRPRPRFGEAGVHHLQ